MYVELKKVQTASLKVSANTSARVEVDGKYEGYTPATIDNIPTGSHTVAFSASGYKPYEKSVYVAPGSNSVYGRLRARPLPVFFADYQASLTTQTGFSLGYCRRLGAYLRFKGSLMDVSAADLKEAASAMTLSKADVSGLEKNYFRRAYTAGGMLRIAKFLYAYGGLGVGQYGVAYKLGEHDGKIASYCPQIIEGLEWEAGATLKMSIFTANLGYNTIKDSQFGELHFGAGLAFDEVTTEGFAGSDDRHEAFGGLHLRASYGLCSADDAVKSICRLDLQYNNSNAFGINVDLGLALGYDVFFGNAGLYSSYFMGDHFAVDYGAGYQLGEMTGSSGGIEFSQPYFKVGASYMFNGRTWGGFNYYYTRGFAAKTPVISTHNISYTIGQYPTLVIGGVTITVGLIALLAVMGKDSETDAALQ